MFHGIVSGFFFRILFMCFSPYKESPPKNINNTLPPTQSRDNPAKLFMFTLWHEIIRRIIPW